MMKVNERIRNVWIIIGILIALIWLSVPVSAIIPGWTIPKTIPGTPEEFWANPHFTYSAPGQWHIIWIYKESDLYHQYYYVTYLDYTGGFPKKIARTERHKVGTHWEGPTIIDVDIASDSNGNLGVIYKTQNNLDTPSRLYYMSRINGLWSNPDPIFNEGSSNDYGLIDPHLAFSAPEKWHVIGELLTQNGGVIEKYELIYLNSTGYTKTLDSSISTNNDVGFLISHPDIASDSNGNLGVIYVKTNEGGESSLKYMSFVNGIWSGPGSIVNNELEDYKSLHLAFSGPGKWHLVWNNRTPDNQDNLNYLNSTGYTGTLVSEKRFYEAWGWKGHYIIEADIASDSHGNLGVVYWDSYASGGQYLDSIKYLSRQLGADLWISEVKPVQVVWDSDINNDGKIDLVAQKQTAIVANITIENPDALDQTVEIPVRLIYDGQIKDTQSKTVEKIRNNGLINLTFTPPTKGEHEVLVIVDPLNDIQESIETNNTHSQKVTVKDVQNMFVSYIPITNPVAPNNLAISPIDMSQYQSTAQNNNKFIQAVFPLGGQDFSSKIQTIPIPASWSSNPGRRKLVDPSSDALRVRYSGLTLQSSASNIRWKRYVGIVPIDYFTARGLITPEGYTPAGFKPRGIIPSTQLIVIGNNISAAHEIAHSFGIAKPPEEEEEYNLAKYKFTSSTGKTIKGKAANGYDVTNLYSRDINNQYLWDSESLSNPFEINGLCVMGEGTKTLPTWICRDDYIELFQALRVSANDPETIFISGMLDSTGKITLGQTKYFAQDIPEEIESGDYSVALLNFNGAEIAEYSFPDPYQAIVEPIGLITMDVGVFGFTIPYPDDVSTIQIKKQDTVLTQFNPKTKLLNDAIDNIPTTGFVKNPDQMRKALQNKVAALDKMIADKQYGEARDKLRDDIKKSVQNWLKDGYSTTNPLEISKEDLLALIDNTIERLDSLAG